MQYCDMSLGCDNDMWKKKARKIQARKMGRQRQEGEEREKVSGKMNIGMGRRKKNGRSG